MKTKEILKCVDRDASVEPVCAWEGCQETYPIFKGIDSIDSLPKSWRVLVVAKGPIWDPLNIAQADVNTPLCPRHYKELLSLMKIGAVKSRKSSKRRSEK